MHGALERLWKCNLAKSARSFVSSGAMLSPGDTNVFSARVRKFERVMGRKLSDARNGCNLAKRARSLVSSGAMPSPGDTGGFEFKYGFEGMLDRNGVPYRNEFVRSVRRPRWGRW